MDSNIRAFIRKDIFGRDLDLYFSKPTSENKHVCITKIEWMEYDRSGCEVEATPMKLKPIEAQNLMDALWDAGLRPSEGSGSAGAMAATQRHLDDMRKLVFKT